MATIALKQKIHAPGTLEMGMSADGEHEHPDDAEKLVVHMIDGMVGVMHDEDVSDEHKKEWCANETEVQHDIEAQKNNLIDKTSVEISEQEDELATTIAEIKGLTEKIAALEKMVHEATEDRKAQHQEFVDMFATSTTAIRLVKKAIARLEKFYSPEKYAKEKKAVEDAALAKAGLGLLQNKQREGTNSLLTKHAEASLLPGGFDAFIQVRASQGTEKQESGGVIGLMNEFVTDLKVEMTEAETSEKFNAKEYVRIMTEAQV